MNATTYTSVADARISYGISEGQLVKYFHDRPETTIVDFADEAFGEAIAKALADGYIVEADAVDFAQTTASTFLGAGAPGVICVSPIEISVDGAYSINAHALFYPEGGPVLDQFVTLMKLQILEDMRANLVPRDVATFSELHDHVDANEYGGFTCESVTSRLRAHFGDDLHASSAATTFFNSAQDQIDTWLRERARTPADEGEAALSRDMLADAYEAFASAAVRLSNCIDEVETEGEACAKDYPFDTDFEDMTARILKWTETSIGRIAPDTRYVATGAVVGSNRIAHAGKFGIDGMVNNLAGYTFGDTWNGWQCPMFTKEVGLLLVGSWDTSDDTTLRYDESRDAFIARERCGNSFESDTYVGTDVLTDDGMKRVYGIGSFGWTWDKAENVGGVPGEEDEEPPQVEQRICHCTDGFGTPRPNCPDCNGTGYMKAEVQS